MTAFPTSRRLAGLGLALAFATGGCGDTPAAPPAPITPIEPVSPPAAVRLAFARAYEPLEPGLPTTFTARAFDATGNVVAPRPGAMTYASSDPAVLREAALASNDTWTGTGGRPGRATLTARLGDLSVSTDIVVRDTTFVLANPGNTVLAGVPRRLLVSYRYLQDSPHVVTFSSASSTDPAVASVDIDGVVSGHTSGRASVSVAYHSQVFAGHVQVVANDTPLRFTQLRTIEGLTCALTGPGALYCWGGRIFEPAFQIDSSCYREFCQSRPTSFPIRTRADLAFGTLGEYMFAPCGLTEAGLVRCLVSAPADISALSLMTLEGGCGVVLDGAGYCSGLNESGERGDGTVSLGLHAMGPISGGITWRMIALDDGSQSYYAHRCGVDVTGNAYCWGNNTGNRLGTGGTAALYPVPQLVRTAQRFSTVSVRDDRSCALTTDGVLACWGPTTAALADVAVNVGGALRFTTLDPQMRCALSTDGLLYCFTDLASTTLARAGPVFALKSFSGGPTQGCGIDLSGITWCWGENGAGALGRGDYVPTSLAVRVAGQ
jgi:hypothetical protein